MRCNCNTTHSAIVLAVVACAALLPRAARGGAVVQRLAQTGINAGTSSQLTFGLTFGGNSSPLVTPLFIKFVAPTTLCTKRAGTVDAVPGSTGQIVPIFPLGTANDTGTLTLTVFVSDSTSGNRICYSTTATGQYSELAGGDATIDITVPPTAWTPPLFPLTQTERVRVFAASLTPLGEGSTVSGRAVLFAAGDGYLLAEAQLTGFNATPAAGCDATYPACGARVHWGTSCAQRTDINTHEEPSGESSPPWWWSPFFDHPAAPRVANASQGSDPWKFAQLNESSFGKSVLRIINDKGDGAFSAIVSGRGWGDHIAGKPFVVHDGNGVRVACGMVEEITSHERIYSASLVPIASTSAGISIANGGITLFEGGDGFVYGSLMMKDLEKSLQGTDDPLYDSATPRTGSFAIYAGTACDVAPGQPLFYPSTIPNPWDEKAYIHSHDAKAYIHSYRTDAEGITHTSFAVRNVIPGNTPMMTRDVLLSGRPFIVESSKDFNALLSTDSNVACGVLTCTIPGNCPVVVDYAAERSAREKKASGTFGYAEIAVVLLCILIIIAVPIVAVIVILIRRQLVAAAHKKRSKTAATSPSPSPSPKRSASRGKGGKGKSAAAATKSGVELAPMSFKALADRNASFRETINPASITAQMRMRDGGAGGASPQSMAPRPSSANFLMHV